MSCLALFQTTLHRKCHPGRPPPIVTDTVGIGVGLPDVGGGLLAGDVTGGLLAGGVGGALLDADLLGVGEPLTVTGGAEEVPIVGALVIGFGDDPFLPLVVGRADPEAEEVSDPVFRLVPK